MRIIRNLWRWFVSTYNTIAEESAHTPPYPFDDAEEAPEWREANIIFMQERAAYYARRKEERAAKQKARH